ncbi:MAG: hypothetical protein CVU47_00335 [Chloroflexi bacterium HGW-Chloroflexi-9]|jgi:hypothetical protein|nr:MAG: hypothetical protein CVU47_00335 [Chloroflexi bacterium HGW-Chloroflexi-9]PKO41744.1 MAG: hypothetical protein CVU33_00130 [Betaproteobacteria bacterium HGW-Betaproteobacteria-6]
MQHLELLAGPLLALGGATLVRKANSLLSLHRSITSWPTVPGIVVRSELHEDTDADGASFRVEISCSYVAEGNTCFTSRHTDGRSFAHPEQSAKALVSAFPVGRSVLISVDPANAAMAVLNTGKPQYAVVIQRIGMVALAAGIGLAAYGMLVAV